MAYLYERRVFRIGSDGMAMGDAHLTVAVKGELKEGEGLLLDFIKNNAKRC